MQLTVKNTNQTSPGRDSNSYHGMYSPFNTNNSDDNNNKIDEDYIFIKDDEESVLIRKRRRIRAKIERKSDTYFLQFKRHFHDLIPLTIKFLIMLIGALIIVQLVSYVRSLKTPFHFIIHNIYQVPDSMGLNQSIDSLLETIEYRKYHLIVNNTYEPHKSIHSKLEVINENSSLVIDQNQDESENVFKKIKNVMTEVYRSVNSTPPNEYCNEKYLFLDGPISASEILQQVDMKKYVVFYKEESETTSQLEGYVNLNDTISQLYDDKQQLIGGQWSPTICKSISKIAIVIPYRDRDIQLKILLYYLNMFLRKQMISFRIFVVEPSTPLEIAFNKGRVMNAAYLEVLKIDKDIECFIFHDVDLVLFTFLFD
jgi:hypothetical protein